MVSNVLTPSQTIMYVKSLISEKSFLKDIMIKGEVTNISARSFAGHLYFSLGDGDAVVNCAMFKRYADSLKSIPENGTSVLVRGGLNVYEKDGRVQLIVYEVQEFGVGEQQVLAEDLKEKLQKEGIFDQSRKRSLVPYPETVGVVTSPDGAAVQDIISTFATTNPLVKVLVYPAVVQGSTGPASIVKAVKQLEKDGLCQCCIVARGGGASEDLDCFNDESVVRCIASCSVPTISAIGHETDVTLVDFAADVRAATPTASVKTATQPIGNFSKRIDILEKNLNDKIEYKIWQKNAEVEKLEYRLLAVSPKEKLTQSRQKLDFLTSQLVQRQNRKISSLSNKVDSMILGLEHLSPVKVLQRGYSITTNTDGKIPTIDQLQVGDTLVTHLPTAKVHTKVTEIEEAEYGN